MAPVFRSTPSPSRDELARSWSVETRELDSEVRRHILFEGDDQTYSRAKLASDGFEHGFLPFQTIREHALATRDTTARYLRKGILGMLGLTAADLEVLLAPPFVMIPTLRVDKYVFGT
jgi:hypothetical protein